MAEAEAEVVTLPLTLDPVGNVSLLKNISRLLCNCAQSENHNVNYIIKNDDNILFLQTNFFNDRLYQCPISSQGYSNASRKREFLFGIFLF